MELLPKFVIIPISQNVLFCSILVPLLARRYRFMETIGSGVSSITICAKDTYHPDEEKVAIKILNVNYYRLGYQVRNTLSKRKKNCIIIIEICCLPTDMNCDIFYFVKQKNLILIK